MLKQKIIYQLDEGAYKPVKAQGPNGLISFS